MKYTQTHTTRNWDLLHLKFAVLSVCALMFSLFHTEHWTGAVLIGCFVYAVLFCWELGEAYDWNEYVKAVMLLYMEWRWGIYGALKPPVRPFAHWEVPTKRQSVALVWYHWRLFCWRVESRVYEWTGLPAIWNSSYSRTCHSERLSN